MQILATPLPSAFPSPQERHRTVAAQRGLCNSVLALPLVSSVILGKFLTSLCLSFLI